MIQPSIEDADRCLELRKQGKQGIRLHPDDQAFCEQMWRDYPKWYASTRWKVFNDTVPFGSDAQHLDTPEEED